MKKINFYWIFIIIIAESIFASEATLLGYWLTSESIVQIKHCENELCAQIEYIFVKEGVDPKSILDSNNTNPELQSRSLIGINLFEGFKKDIDVNKSIKGGRIYSPKEGKFFKAKLSLLKNGDLKVEGCVLFICDGEEWKPLIVTINPDGSHTAVLKNAPEG